MCRPAKPRAWILAVAVAATLASRAYGDDVERRPGESVSSYGKRQVPAGNELVANPVDLKLGELGRVIVVLFKPKEGIWNYSGWVLAPASADSRAYRRLALPRSDAGQGRVGVEVKSIFSADVDGDSQPELCILSKEYEYGTGDDSYFATDCYHEATDKFELIEALAPLSIGLKNAKAVRDHFAKHPIKLGTALPGSIPR